MILQVMVVEDEPGDLEQYLADFPDVFQRHGVEANLHGFARFEDAKAAIADQSRRFDLVVSDTYAGKVINRDAQVLDVVRSYREGGKRFCPVVVYSSSVKPELLVESEFVKWANKAKPNGIENAIAEMLSTGIPQISRRLYDELDRSGGSFLWDFLEANWDRLNARDKLLPEILERLIRRRAAAQIADMEWAEGKWIPIIERTAAEYYIYPRLETDYFGLGDILRHRENKHDYRVILTPHCHLFIHPGKQKANADYVLTVKTVDAREVLGEKIGNAAQLEEIKQQKKLSQWSRSPAGTDRVPAGRHWYLPAFLDIPHLYCDFLQVEGIPYDDLRGFDAIATLVPPYTEAMQSCFAGFYASVGIPEMKTESIADLLKD